MFDLCRPCVTCPFRKGVGETFQFSRDRIKAIVVAPAFQCHKTVDYDFKEGDPRRKGSRPQQCAGLMVILHHEGIPNQIMQVAERLTSWRAANIDATDVYDSLGAAIVAHGDG